VTPEAIIKQSSADGVALSLGDGGKIRFSGDEDQVAKWLPLFREHKVSIVGLLSKACNDEPDTMAVKMVGATKSETVGPTTLLSVVSLEKIECKASEVLDAPANNIFSGSEIETDQNVFTDERRTCNQCYNLHARICSIARPGGLISAVKGYRPGLMFREQLHRCEGYEACR
jgi:hypothetical protein